MRKRLFFLHFLILTSVIQMVLACQTRNETTAKTNRYSQMNNQQLTDETKAFVEELRSLNKRFRKITDESPVRDRDAISKLQEADAVQAEYERNFAARARDLEKELLSRVPIDARPKDTPSQSAGMLISSGKLMGADPPDAIAAYMEALMMRLPKPNTPQK